MASTARRTQGQRRAETRRALLDAAAELFAKRGYHAVSLDEIAARAGYTRGALHYNFSGKQDLLLRLLEERLAARGTALAGSRPDALVGALPFDREFSLLFLEFAAEAARDRQTGAALRTQLEAGRRANVPAAEDLLARAGIPEAPAEALLQIVGAFVNGLSIEALAGADLGELEGRFGLLLSLLFDGLRARSAISRAT
jgi:AcrR family transcriptional regulator